MRVMRLLSEHEEKTERAMKYTIAFVGYRSMGTVVLGSLQTESWDEVISFLTEEILDEILDDIREGDLSDDILHEDEEDFSRDTVMIFRGENHEIVDYPRETVIPLVRQKLKEEDRKREEREMERRERDDRATFDRLKARYGQ